MKDKFVIFAEEPPIELQLSTEMRCREIEDNPDIEYVKRYCISLLRNNAKRDAILAATLQELAEAHVTIAKAEQVQIIHWWVLRRMIKNFFISIALFIVIKLNKLLTARNNKINKKI
tara:strand:+ start:588 stop:938 length:351 start_codon:yes stop_codon:yes gene_type:complete